MSRYVSGYGNWVNAQGDKLRGAPASSLPKSGPLASYKAGGVGAGTLKRSASYGPSKSTSKALTKPVAGTKGAAGGALAKAKTTVGSGAGAGAGALKPYTTFLKDSDKENEDAAAKKRKAKKKAMANGAGLDSKPATYKPSAPRPTGLGRTQSFPGNKNAEKKSTYAAPKTKVVDGVKKTSISTASKPQAKKAYTPYKPSESGGGHVPLPGGFGDKKEGSGSVKGYTPYKGPAGDDKDKNKKSGGGHIPLPGGIGDSNGKDAGGSKNYKPYTPSNKGASGGGQEKGEKKIDRTFF